METAFTDGWATPVRFLKGVGEARAAMLGRMDIHTVGDLLFTIPRRYEDRHQLASIRDVKANGYATICGEVSSSGWIKPRFGKGYFEAVIRDGTGAIRCRWFGAAYLKDQLKQGEQVVVYGKTARFRGEAYFQHPEFEAANDEGEESIHVGRIVPIYPLTENLSQRVMRRILWHAVERFCPMAPEVLPEETKQRWHFGALEEAVRTVHFPENLATPSVARSRLVFEEFLCMQLVLVARKLQTERHIEGTAFAARGLLAGRLLAALPFTLTGAQARTLEELRGDMRKPRPMHRLLQGDVGSGKTIVAALAVADALECGAQAAVMAPTEILAAQHFKTFSRYLAPLGIKIDMLAGSLSAQEKICARAAIADGRTHVVVGTHALIQDRVAFKKLGLVIIDEQHKFGVEQRGVLYGKGEHPDVLVMTATPIPRTLAMTLYGDLDVSIIDELPAGRQAIVTKVINEAHLEKAYEYIVQQVRKGRQAYMVYPLVNESDKLELKSAVEMFEHLKRTAFQSIRLGLLHGQMDAEDKEDVMRRYRSGEVDVLVATTVIEVGVDVPNATVMLIENAERFGLAQLHQLRGRIGRGEHKSYCMLQGRPGSFDAWKRLKIMETTSNGFRIAEEDFKIRGMGNLLGREQSGVPMLRVGNLLEDVKWLEAARQEAFTLLDKDPKLRSPEMAPLRDRARALYKAASGFVKIG